MNSVSPRRQFLKQTSLAAGMTALGGFNILRAAESPSTKLRIGIMGCNNRGMDHIAGHLTVPNLEIACICDVDSRAVEKGIAAVERKTGQRPKGVTDFRRMLDDKNVDAISIATPDFWHAPAMIMACAAGKHVYVEKPGSHNGYESELMVAAARKYKRVVQMGNQRRSFPFVIEAMQALHAGEIGKVHLARTWYTNKRQSIGRGKVVPVPDWLDFSLWQGPAPERPYRDNIIHYNWHWFWVWGTSELGNNGVHGLDLARWGLQVEYPRRVTLAGGRYHAEDDWEMPDTTIATFDYGNCLVVWEGQSCDPRGFEDSTFGINFHGDKGVMSITSMTCRIFDPSNKLIREFKGKKDEGWHFQNFANAIREGKKLNSEIEEGQKATLLCHLGNIAWRTGQTVDYDPVKRKMIASREGQALWKREYRKGWEPKV